MKKKIIIAGLCMATIMATAGISAYFTDTVQVKNNFQTGIVKIQIDEYEKTPDGEEKPYEDPKTEIVPGDNISKIARITNKEVDAWIRAKVTFNFEDEKLNGSLTFNNLQGINSEKWILAKDGYFYYKEVVKSGEAVDLFSGVIIPAEWNNSYANCKFTIDVEADGIQARNFTPQFNSDSPWGNVEIETCAYPEAEVSNSGLKKDEETSSAIENFKNEENIASSQNE